MRLAPGNRRIEVIISNPVLACHRTAGELDLHDPPVFPDAVRGLVVLHPPVRVRLVHPLLLLGLH